jgi:hypothetical protein
MFEPIISEETVYLVKFERGYYAAKQPHYDWSFTDNPSLAQKYKTVKNANERGEYGTHLITNPLQSYVIERFTLKTMLVLEGSALEVGLQGSESSLSNFGPDEMPLG